MPRVKLSKVSALRGGFEEESLQCEQSLATRGQACRHRAPGSAGQTNGKKLEPGASSPTLPHSGMFFRGVQEPKFDSERSHCCEGVFVEVGG